jgi:hypothetical protein
MTVPPTVLAPATPTRTSRGQAPAPPSSVLSRPGAGSRNAFLRPQPSAGVPTAWRANEAASDLGRDPTILPSSSCSTVKEP